MNDETEHRNWWIETDFDDIAWLHFDKAKSSTNVLSAEVLEELNQLLEDIDRESPRGLVVLSDKPNGFIAGADVTEFTSITDRDTALQLIRRGQEVIDRLANLSFPTVSLIHGFCLGGGLELALACRYRVARDDSGTRLGLPEVRLGIHPGFGGSVRLPRLIGGLAAMDLMLSGRTVSSYQARKLGIVDKIVPDRHLRAAACALILEPPPKHRPKWWAGLTNAAPARKLASVFLRKKVAERAPAEHYPAPYALIDLWENHFDGPLTMLRKEAESVAGLITGPAAQNLVRTFLLQERLKGLGKKTDQVVEHVHVVGAGIMGGDIAAWCAVQGLRVTLQDREPKYIAPAIQRAHALFRRRFKISREVQAAMDRLMPDHKGVGISQADVVIEAIFEDRDAKRALYREIEPRLKPGAWLATNTSSIPLEELTEDMEQPERLVGLHFFNPVAKMQLVEIVKSIVSSDAVVKHALAFARRIDRLPLPVRSSPGFLVNRALMPYLLEAVILESEGIPAPVIDKAARQFGMPMGPVELADTVGLDICLHVAEILGSQLGTEIPERLRSLVAAGQLGRKSGSGFYKYKKGKPVRIKVEKDYHPPDYLTDRLILPLLNATVACVREGVVDTPDFADAGMIYGTGFAPFLGGPIHYIQDEGADRLHDKMKHLEAAYGERYAPDAGWEQFAEIGADHAG